MSHVLDIVLHCTTPAESRTTNDVLEVDETQVRRTDLFPARVLIFNGVVGTTGVSTVLLLGAIGPDGATTGLTAMGAWGAD
jgi:hypothetical protein